MKALLLTVALLIASIAIPIDNAFSQTYIQGYYRSNGTYVAPHWKSSPDRSYNNNWSVKPNYNPYTGKRGTRNPTWNDRNLDQSPYQRNYQKWWE